MSGARVLVALSAALSIGLAGAAGAQSVEQKGLGAPSPWPLADAGLLPEGAELLVGEAFRERFLGRTARFDRMDGTLWGYEYYRPDGGDVVFQDFAGECFEGHWVERKQQVCFTYDIGGACWLTYEHEGGLFVVADAENRFAITEILDDRPLSCNAGMVRRAPERGDARPAG